MSDPASPIAFSARVPGAPKAAATAFLWTIASLITALAIYALVLAAAQHRREAALAVDTAQGGAGYAGVIVGVMALRHGFPSQNR